MPPHIDMYSIVDHGNEVWRFGPRDVFMVGKEAVKFAERHSPPHPHALPYFNMYNLLTLLHEDSECAEHKPEDLVLGEPEFVKGTGSTI